MGRYIRTGFRNGSFPLSPLLVILALAPVLYSDGASTLLFAGPDGWCGRVNANDAENAVECECEQEVLLSPISWLMVKATKTIDNLAGVAPWRIQRAREFQPKDVSLLPSRTNGFLEVCLFQTSGLLDPR